MKVFVVGGAGFVGSHLVERLLADGHVVDVVDDYSTGGLANLGDARSMGAELKIHHLDAASPEAASLIGMKRPDVLYHLAAVHRRADDPRSAAITFANTVALLAAVRQHRVPKVVAALPASRMYGRPDIRDLPLKELPLEPRGLSGVIARATVDVLTMHREEAAVEFTALAMAHVYGPRQRPDGGVVASMIDRARRGEPPRIVGDGRQTRDFLYVDDAVDALVRAGERGSGLVVNVGTGEQTSINDLWTLISGRPPHDAEVVPPSADLLGRFAVSPVRARIHLGWSPWTTLQDGVRNLV